MGDLSDLELIIKSKLPLVLVETHEERQVLDLFSRLALSLNIPLYTWTITDGLKRKDIDFGSTTEVDPTEALKNIKNTTESGIYLLLDFHPYFEEPINVRLVKEIAHAYYKLGHTLVLISHQMEIPSGLDKLTARFELELPDEDKLMQIIKDEAYGWSKLHQNRKVRTDRKTVDQLLTNLKGLTVSDARRLARKVINDDGAITENDLPAVMKAKYELLNKDGLLSFEYDTERFADVGGMSRVKRWLEVRKEVFSGNAAVQGMDAPKGILLLGVQGCGKSLVAKAVAGVFAVPLLRLDFGTLYNKFFGESEKNLRDALKTAEVMAPCVLWIDEIEKGLTTGDNDGGTSRRVLGTLLTWMSDRSCPVFIVATANDIETLPPELVRKGRFDEIFFVDLPDSDSRKRIFTIHLEKRNIAVDDFDLEVLVGASEGFSGAEIEQAVVSSLYSVYTSKQELKTDHILHELHNTRPLSIVMEEKIARLRSWAQARTVPAD